MAEPTAAEHVAALLPKLRSAKLTYFPIRHHSPACAAHIRRWVQTNKPASVLVEGPASFTNKIDWLTDDRCVCPVALYTTFVDKRHRLLGELGIPAIPTTPPRFAAFYPFCDYSPELVALRAGRAVGARLRFIDLEYPEMILARHGSPPPEKDGVRVDSLAADLHLSHSAYVKALAVKLGLRDFNEVWDHLFEAGADSLDTEAFINRVATYCAMARFDYTTERLQRDGTPAREACMAALIRDEMACNEKEGRAGPVLVVTGGFHTVALPDLVAMNTQRSTPLELADDEAGTWLMRYSFDQLDALAGYASGMPCPAFYDRLWKAAAQAERARAAVDLIVEIGRLTRERKFPVPITTPDAISASQMAKQLAAMRGHPWPLREDVLDGIRACFIKGEVGVEGRGLLQIVREVLAGNRIGDLPPGTGVPPIVDDFYHEAKRFRLPVETVEKRESVLDLYRNATHRQISRLFHRLAILDVPFASFRSGPDFVHGHGLDLIQEHWQVSWSPATESALIEAIVFGPTIEEAAAAKLRQEIARLQDEGQGRSAAAAVEVLVRACRLGLHDQATSLVPLIELHIAEDPAFPSVVVGLSQMEMLAGAREPLEASHLTALPQMMASAYQRACRLLGDVAGCPDELVEPIIGSMRTLREVLAGAKPETGLDAALFRQGLRRVIEHPADKAQAAVVGAAVGILYGEGELPEAELVRVVSGYLGGAMQDKRKTCGIIRGLLATAREIAWQVSEIVRALDAQMQSWDETAFLEALPELRLAFTDLTPREVARVADHVAGLHGETTLGELVHTDVGEEEVHFGLELTRRVREVLRADNLVPLSPGGRGVRGFQG